MTTLGCAVTRCAGPAKGLAQGRAAIHGALERAPREEVGILPTGACCTARAGHAVSWGAHPAAGLATAALRELQGALLQGARSMPTADPQYAPEGVPLGASRLGDGLRALLGVGEGPYSLQAVLNAHASLYTLQHDVRTLLLLLYAPEVMANRAAMTGRD